MKDLEKIETCVTCGYRQSEQFELGMQAGRHYAVANMTCLALVGRLRASGKFKEMKLDPVKHATKNYVIVRWVKPDEIDEPQQFEVSGPGHRGKMYLALSDDCGPQFIQALQAAYDAGVSSAQRAVDANEPIGGWDARDTDLKGRLFTMPCLNINGVRHVSVDHVVIVMENMAIVRHAYKVERLEAHRTTDEETETI